MSTRLQLLIGLLLLVIGLAIGRYSLPAKVVTVTRIERQDHDVIKTNVVTVTKVVKQPNGTTETNTTVTDHSVTNDQSNTVSQTEKTVTRNQPDWRVGAQFSSSSNLPGYLYGVTVDRRILGPISIGVFGNANRAFGAQIGIEF